MAACDALAEEAEAARERAEEAASETKDELQEARTDTLQAISVCGVAAGGFAAGLAAGIAAAPACLATAWEAVTSWCDVRESGRSTGEAAKEASAAQTAYLACLNNHKKR